MKRKLLITLSLLTVVAFTGCASESSDLAPTKNETDLAKAFERIEEYPTEALPFYKDSQGIEKTIMVHSQWILDAMVSLGVAPNYAINFNTGFNGEFPKHLDNILQLSGTENLGKESDYLASAEKVIALNPDIILVDEGTFEEWNDNSVVYTAIRTAGIEVIEVAPTGGWEYLEGHEWEYENNWRGMVQAVAQALTLDESLVTDAINTYETTYEKYSAEIKEALHEENVMILRAIPGDGNVFNWQNTRFYDVLYSEHWLNIAPPEGAPTAESDNWGSPEISLESILKVNPDNIIIINQNDDAISSLENNALWNELDAVKNNQVYTSSYEIWQDSYGAIHGLALINDLYSFFVKDIGQILY